MTIDAFERFVQAQRPATEPWTPVTDYSFEARRLVEGRHPDLILDTFTPTKILDVGCGPGHLVTLLNERAGYSIAFGVDKQSESDFVLDVTTPRLSWNATADLVICREVLEHLTVLEVRRAVANLCMMSSRFVYVTTRFNTEAQGLLDVQTADDLDPTHITMLNKDFLRLLFVLEGFERRADLETTMDWRGYNRVLVYERAA